jgi:leader peptidase (prepilin peptidase)/N-methyltransferase
MVLALAAALGLVPQRLIAETAGRPRGWRSALPLALIGAAAGLAAVAACTAIGREADALRLGVAATCLAELLAVDAAWLVIPDLYVAVLAAAAIVWIGRIGWLGAGLGAALGAGLLALVRWLFLRLRGVEGLGLGDVKLLAALGALAGPERVLWIVLGGAAVGVVWALLRPARDGEAGLLAPFGACAAIPAFAVLAIGRWP